MTAFIIDLISRGGYLGIVLLMALENVFPPIPSEVIMGVGGIAASRGQFSIGWLIAAGTLGTVAGNYAWYALGRRLGYQGLKPFVDRHGRWLTMDWQDVERISGFFHRRGWWVVFVFRFLPTFRTIISLPAGMAKMPRWLFLLATAAGSAIWNAVLAGAGLYLGNNFDAIERFVGPVAIASIVAVLVLYLYRVVTWRPHAER